MTTHYSLLVPGAKAAAKKLEVIAPFDGSLMATVDKVDETGIEQALSTAAELFNDKSSWLTTAQRIDILHKLKQLMTDNAERLILISAQEGGKPLIDTQVQGVQRLRFA